MTSSASSAIRQQNSFKTLKSRLMANIPKKFFGYSLLTRLLEDFKLLVLLIRDYWRGAYRSVSVWSIVVFSFAIIYIIDPIDIIPDFNLGLGQIDDAAVLVLCLNFLEKDLYKYKEWKEKNRGGTS